MPSIMNDDQVAIPNSENISAKESHMLLNVSFMRDVAVSIEKLTPGDQAVCRRLVARGLMEPAGTPGFRLTQAGESRATKIVSSVAPANWLLQSIPPGQD